MKFKNKIKGMLWGGAYGDALGAPIEKLTYKEKNKKYGYVNSLSVKWWKSKSISNGRVRGNGIFTDDTLFTLCLLSVYNKLKRNLDAWDLNKYLVEEIFLKKIYIPELKKKSILLERAFYPEKNILLRNALANADPRSAGIGNAVNCGAAMYAAPVGAVNACDPEKAYAEAINFFSAHQHSYGLEAAGVMAACVASSFIDGIKENKIIEMSIDIAKDGTKAALSDIYNTALKERKNKDDKDHIVERFHKIMSRYSTVKDNFNITRDNIGKINDNYVPSRTKSIEELPMAIGYLALHQNNYQNAIFDAVNSGRDVDSIGSMLGSIYGAIYGDIIVSEADRKLIKKNNKYDFDIIGEKFSKTCQLIQKSNEIKSLNIRDLRKKLF